MHMKHPDLQYKVKSMMALSSVIRLETTTTKGVLAN